MAICVGLDIGTRKISGAVFTGGKRFHLTDFFVLDISTAGAAPPEDGGLPELAVPPSIGEAVAKALAERNLQGADVIAAVEAKDAIIREIVVPFTKEDHIRKIISAEAEEHFQTYDIADVQLEFTKVEELGDKSRVVIAAVRNSAIRDRLELLKSAGVDPVSLDLDAAALFNAFALTHHFDPERTVLLIDMGATSTKVLLIEKGRLKKIRSIRMTSSVSPSRMIPEPVGAGATASLPIPLPDSGSIEARFAEIESALLKMEPGEEGMEPGGGDEPIAILTDEEYDLVRGGESPEDDGGPDGPGLGGGTATEDREEPRAERPSGNGFPGFPPPPAEEEMDFGRYLDRLGIEIQRTFASTFALGGVDLICLTGGLSRQEEARRFFAEGLDVETIALDFGDSFPMDIPEDARPEVSRVGAVAVGLAVKELGGDRIGFDFRKEQFRFERRFERIKFPILALALLVLLFFAHTAFILWQKMVAFDDQVARIQEKEQSMFQAFFGKKNSSEKLYQVALNEKKGWGVGSGNLQTFIPFAEAVEEVSRAIKETGAMVRIKSIDLKLRTTQTGGVQGRLSGEASSLAITTEEKGLGTRLESQFTRNPNGIFEASAQETSDASGKTNLTLSLKVKKAYLEKLGKAR
jgi:Tfp pilus assembly PilM family ATPase